jgi:hypothetical protein
VIVLHTAAGADAAAALEQIKFAAKRFPGRHRLRLHVRMASGEERRVTLGKDWRYDASPACLTALSEFGRAEAVDE